MTDGTDEGFICRLRRVCFILATVQGWACAFLVLLFFLGDADFQIKGIVAFLFIEICFVLVGLVAAFRYLTKDLASEIEMYALSRVSKYMSGEEAQKKRRSVENSNDPLEQKNDEGLTASQIIGRCGKCSNHGTIDVAKNKLPPKLVDAILAYKVVPSVFCRVCMKPTEFIPTEVKKYRDVPLLARLQKQMVEGIPGLEPLPPFIVDENGRPLEK